MEKEESQILTEKETLEKLEVQEMEAKREGQLEEKSGQEKRGGKVTGNLRK